MTIGWNSQTQIQDLWANKDSALRHVMGSWSALIGRWKSWIVICEVGFQDLQLANMVNTNCSIKIFAHQNRIPGGATKGKYISFHFNHRWDVPSSLWVPSLAFVELCICIPKFTQPGWQKPSALSESTYLQIFSTKTPFFRSARTSCTTVTRGWTRGPALKIWINCIAL